MNAPLITLEDVSVYYGPHKALQDVSGAFYKGSLTAIAGPNGAGKSTLLKVIAGLVRPRQGQVILSKQTQSKIGYLPQSSTVSRDYPLSVLQAACTGFWPEIKDTGTITLAHKTRARQALADIGLADMENRQVGQLSGGQFQKLLFTRLLLQEPEILLLDEPFAAVDAETTGRLMQILLAWHKAGKTIICVLHDLLLIKKYFPESFLLAGKCLGRGHTHALFVQKLLSFDLDMAEIRTPEDGRKA